MVVVGLATSAESIGMYSGLSEDICIEVLEISNPDNLVVGWSFDLVSVLSGKNN